MTLPVALTMGEPSGIGGEVTLKSWRERAAHNLPAFFVIDDPDRLAVLAAALRIDVPVRAIAEPAEAARVFATALPVLPQPLPKPALIGKPDPANALAVIGAIERAVKLVQSGRAAALVTNPIQKELLYAAGFEYPGHTEFLGALARAPTPVMMLVGKDLRVVPVTIHVSLAEAARSLTTEAIVACGRITAKALQRDFGIARPRLCIAGLNPHAGEGGAMGHEEQDIIAPAVAALAKDGIDVVGPRSADTMFHPAARRRYDVALCMYHDQALIPIKTLDFDNGVNVTLGLPFIRTSPDHGTALDIAGKGVAKPDSLIASIALAGAMVARRAAHPAPV